MRLGQHFPHDLGGVSGIDQVIYNQPAFAIARLSGIFQDGGCALLFMIIGRNTDRIDQAHIQFPRHNGGRDQTAPRDCDNAIQGLQFRQSPCQGTGVAVQFFPGNGIFFVASLCHGNPVKSHKTVSMP